MSRARSSSDRRRMVPLWAEQAELLRRLLDRGRQARFAASSTSAPATACSRDGHGRATRTVEAVLVDFSEPMLAAAASRLDSKTGRWGSVEADLSSPRWRERPSGRRALRRRRVGTLHPPPARRAQAAALRGGVRPARGGRPLPELGARHRRRAGRRACSTSGWWRGSSGSSGRVRSRGRRKRSPASIGLVPMRLTTSCWIQRPNATGCARSASSRSMSSSGGSSWRCSAASGRPSRKEHADGAGSRLSRGASRRSTVPTSTRTRSSRSSS